MTTSVLHSNSFVSFQAPQQPGTTVPDCPTKRYNEEAVRLESFHNWDYDFIDKRKLAQYGFYSMGSSDTVKCHFCRVEIGQWDVGDNVLREHIRWSPYCPLIKRQVTDNVPLDPDSLEASLPPQSFDICGTNEVELRPNSYVENETPPMFINNYPDFSLESDRLKSFECWPKAIKQKPVDLSEAGFFYIGKGDQVKCFSCGGGLKDWEEADVPWEQHALWYPKCHYLNLMKDKEYIEKVKHDMNSMPGENDSSSSGYQSGSPSLDVDIVPIPAVNKLLPPPPASATETSTGEKNRDINSNDDAKMCKICYNEELNTALFPCMHIITCAKCAVALTNCPICRKKITEIKRIYFS